MMPSFIMAKTSGKECWMSISRTPGIHFDYQSENYELLALILERASGMKVSSYLHQKLWQPLGMERECILDVDNPD